MWRIMRVRKRDAVARRRRLRCNKSVAVCAQIVVIEPTCDTADALHRIRQPLQQQQQLGTFIDTNQLHRHLHHLACRLRVHIPFRVAATSCVRYLSPRSSDSTSGERSAVQANESILIIVGGHTIPLFILIKMCNGAHIGY